MHTSYLQRIALTTHRSTHKESATGMWGWGMQSVGHACGPGRGNCRQDIPSSAWKVLLTESIKRLIGSTLLWWVPSPSFYARIISQPLRHADHLSSLRGVRNSGPLWQHPAQLGKPGPYSLCSHFPPWEKSQSKGIPPGTELCHLGGGVTLVKWTFLLTLFSASVLEVFCS